MLSINNTPTNKPPPRAHKKGDPKAAFVTIDSEVIINYLAGNSIAIASVVPLATATLQGFDSGFFQYLN